MGDRHQFRLPFPTQQNPFANNTQNSAVSQEPSSFQNSQNIFSSADPKPVFGSAAPNANSIETKNSIFGGSAFAKPNENSFTTQGRQNIFGGTAHLNAPSQPALPVLPNSEANTNVSQPILFSRPQTIFGGLSAKTDVAVSTGANSIFGGTVKSQNSGEKGNPFSDVTSINAEPTSTTKLSIFGGSYMKKEEPSLRLGFSTFSKTQETDSENLEKSKNPPTSLPEKQSLFPSSKSSFAGFPSSSGVVTSSRTHQAQEKTDAFEFEKKEPLLSQSMKHSRDQASWEPDSVDHENKDDSASDQSKGRSTKIIRKRGVFGKAIEDVAKLSSRSTPTDETRSIVCHPLSGDFPDVSVLKDYFSRFRPVRVTINKDRRYAIATFKNHVDAAKAMDAGDVIDGVKYRIFWRNLAKVRRKSSEEGEKARSSEEKRKVSRRVEPEFDSSVIEELEAISGLEYFTPGDRTKRKSELESEIRKKSRTVSKPSSEIEKAKTNESDKGIRNSSQGIEGSRPRLAGSLKDIRMDEKSSLRTKKIATERMSLKKSNETDEGKSEKNERGTSDSTVTPSAASSELLVILKQQAVSSDDKLRVLEARDKLMRLRKVKQYDISKAVKTVGTCPDMCPEKERLLRESRRQISQYEMNVSKNEMDPNLMVKQYSRSSADQEEPLPHELRPPAVLTMTMNYLMHGIMNLGDQPGENLGEWYHFLWDRLRGIRKEITQQELCDIDAVRLVEQCARFHIHCGARLVAEDMSVFDDRINTENLTKCLQTLKHMYHDLWMNSSVTCPYESEFISYFLLLNLNNGTIMWEMEQLREEVLESPEIGFVAAMYNSLSSNNFVRFFRLVRKASYLNSCLCIRYFYQVRAKALATLVKALAKIRPVQYPLLALVEDLGFENAENAATFCTHYGLAVSSDSACVILSQETFCNPTFVLPSERAFRLVESKKIGSVGEVVNGGPLPFRMYESHTVHNSFDGNNYLHKNAFYAKDQGAADMDIKDVDGDVCSEEADQTENLAVQEVAAGVVQRFKEEIQTEKKIPSQPAPVSFGGLANQKLLFSSAFSSTQPVSPSPFGSTNSQVFKGAFNLPVNVQAPPERQETLRSNTLQVPTSLEPARGLVSRNVFVDRNQAEIEAQKKARAELDATINQGAEIQFEDLLQSSIREVTAEVTVEEMKTAQEEHFAEERRRAEEHMHAIEELRKRALEAHIDKISNDSLLGLVSEVVSELIFDSAHEANVAEETLIADINTVSEETLSSLMCLVVEEFCCDIASEELRCAKELARKEAVQQRVKQIFYHWLERARHSLHRKCVMEDFPASVIPLSLKEHAERWGFSTNLQDVCVKRDKKILDLRDLKATPTYPQITFAELVGIQAVHRYDSIRSKMGLRPTDKLLYKLFISIPEEEKDVAAQLIEWWIRRTFKQNSGILHDNVQKGIYRVVSGAKVTTEVAVYASLQVVRGNDPLTKHTGLASGTSAVLFSVSATSNILESRSRLTTLLKSVSKLPAMPLVVTVVCPSEPPLDGLKQLVVELELDQWLGQGIISDYQILHVENLFDLKYLAERFNMALNYMVMTWTPCPEFSLVCLKNVLRSTFQMFYISIQYNHNSSGVYPQDIDDPRVIIGLCNEWLDHMCHEFVTSYYEARDLCGEEFWPLLHKGAYLPFLNKPRYVELLQEVIKSVCLPPMQWPPSSEEEFETMFTQYCSWLRPEEYKQTQRRLSCLNGLLWSDKIKSLPWINLIEDWMEARINYIETSIICGSELLCLMKPQNVEQLYTYPWWAQSKYVTSYLESLGLGRECEMDVDQTVPSENVDDEQGEECTSEAGQRQPNLNSGLSQLEEVACCVNELKGVNESLLTRLRSALADGAGDVSSTINSSVIERENINVTEVPSSTQGFKTLVNTIDLQVQAQRDLRTRISHILSSALAEESEPKDSNHAGQVVDPSSFADRAVHNSAIVKSSNQTDVIVGSSHDGQTKSSSRMNEIMASMNDIVASLNKKYKILESESNLEKVTDLKMGLGKIDAYSTLLSTEDLHPSPFIEQSQRRMQERLQGSMFRDIPESRDKSPPAPVDSDLELLSDERSTSSVVRSFSSPTTLESESIKSESDLVEDYGDDSDHVEEEDEEDYKHSANKKGHHFDASDDNRNPPKKSRHHSDDSSEYSHSRTKKRSHSEDDDASYSGSYRSYQDSECESLDDDVQTISSEESRDGAANHNANPKSPSVHNDDYYGSEDHQPSLNPVGFSSVVLSQNDLVNEDNVEGHLLNLDNVSNHYEYYDDQTNVQDPVYSESSEVGVLHADGANEMLSRHGDNILLNDNVLLMDMVQQQNSDHLQENVYEVEIDRSDVQEYNQSEGTLFTMPPDGDYNESQYVHPNQSRTMKYEDSGSEDVEEECEDRKDNIENDGEEEEAEEEEVEDDVDDIEEEAYEEQEEENDEPETDVESDPDEDSDVCEVIDDD